MLSAREVTPELKEVNMAVASAGEVTPEQVLRIRNVGASPVKSPVENVVSDGKIDGPELSHSLNGEYRIRRNTETPGERRHRKKVKKTKWQNAFNVLIMVCLLLGSVLWLSQLVWTWRDMMKYSSDPSFVILDGEGRLSEMQVSLKTTAEMLQIQLDVVDKKVVTEVETAKNEMSDNLEKKSKVLEEDLKRLEVRTDSLDKSLAGFKVTEFLSKNELAIFSNDLKKRGAVGLNAQNMSLDAIRNIAKQIVEKEIEKHAADGLGRVDYALAISGARVVYHSDPYTHGLSGNWITIGKSPYKVYSHAKKMLEPTFGEPGQCFALKGSSGFVDIRLRTKIIPEAVTLEHLSKSVAYDRSSAPKDCRVLAWFETPEDDSSNLTDKMSFLTEFTYDLEKSNAQTFDVETVNARAINMIRFAFSTNHGSSTLTCIYRLRVHGYEPNQHSAFV